MFFDVLLKQRDAQLQALGRPDTVAPAPGASQRQPEQTAAAAPGSDEPDDDETPPASRQDGPKTPASAGNDQQDTERLRLADLRRYEQRPKGTRLKAVRAGRPVKVFDSDAIAPAALAALRERLARCETAEDVRAVFADAERAAAKPDYPESDHWVTINGNPVLIPAPHATQRAAVEANIHPVLEHAARQRREQPDVTRRLAERAMANYIRESAVVVKRPQHILPDILAAGFKNQHQTGTSEGVHDPARRRNVEGKLFNIADQAPPESRPIYGYFRHQNGGTDANAAFGDAKVFLKPSVKARATYTVGDSLENAEDDRVLPALADHPHLLAADEHLSDLLPANNRKRPLTGAEVDRQMGSQGVQYGYAEAQIHGGVAAGDIDHVVFEKPPHPNVVDALNRAGISWREELTP